MDDPVLVARLEGVWLAATLTHAGHVARLVPSLGTVTFPVGDGWAVLYGPGMFVNRVLAVGVADDVSPEAIDELERRAVARGLAPEFEVTELTRRSLGDELDRRGYVEVGSVTAFVGVPARLATEVPPGIVIAPASVAEFQAASAAGLEAFDGPRRRANDAYVLGAHASGQVMLIARDATDGRVLGSAAVEFADGVAMLAAMSTYPVERRRGVQAALVAHRAQLAFAAGCDVLAASAVTGGGSARNLERIGFTPTHTKRTFRRESSDR